jgi:hypothetical protein
LKWDYAKLTNRPDLKILMELLLKWFEDYNLYYPHITLIFMKAELFHGGTSLKTTGGTEFHGQNQLPLI